MSKYITDELIEERLKKRGLSSYEGYGAEDEDADYKNFSNTLIAAWNE